MKAGTPWILLRLAAVALVAWALLAIPVARSNLEWGAGVSIGAIFSGALYLWLMAIRTRADVELSQPFSLQQPFFPLGRYPLRYWFVASYSLVIGGGIVACRDFIAHNGRSGVGGSFLIVGLFIAATLLLWMRLHAAKE